MSVQNNKVSEHLKLKQSNEDSRKLVNRRGDFVICHSPGHYNVNGSHIYSARDAASAIGKWGSNNKK